MKSNKNDIYQEVTNAIVECLEMGNIPWVKPWASTEDFLPINAASGKHYSGINTMILWARQFKNDFTSNQWVTYKQAVELGGKVKKGEKSVRCIFYKPLKIEDEETQEEKVIPMLKTFNLFNVEQCEGLTLKFKPSSEPKQAKNLISLEVARANGAKVVQGGNRAYYSLSSDNIHMPFFESFNIDAGFEAVLFHELTHWTGANTRLNRDMGGSMKSDSYAKEELIAEMGAAFLCATYNVKQDMLIHSGYIQSWLKALKSDKKAIFTAAAAAQKATDFINENYNNAQQVAV